MLSETEKAYLAGFFDGDGCVSIIKYFSDRTPTPIYSLTVVISQSNLEFIEEIKSLCGGGSISINKNLPESRPIEYKIPHYTLRMSSVPAEKFLREIYPYTKSRKKQIEIALKFRETFKNIKMINNRVPAEIIENREHYRQLLRKTKTKGRGLK